VFPTVTEEDPCTPIKEQELQPSHLGEKKGNWHHNKHPAMGNISSIPLSEELQEKQTQNPNSRDTRIKTLT
jgi:hypothetical protein